MIKIKDLKIVVAKNIHKKTIDIIVDSCRYFTITRDYSILKAGVSVDYDSIDFEPTCNKMFSEKEKRDIMALHDGGEFEKWF
jgi:hypothetical protein